MKFRFTDGTVTKYGRVTHGGTAYNLPGMTEQDRAAVGSIVEIDALPDERFYAVTEGAVELDGDTWRQRWTATARSTEEIAAAMAAIKADAKRRVALRADEIAEVITGAVPLSEKLSWTLKESAARAHQADTATAEQTALLTAEASVTGETLDDLAASILSNVATYNAATGAIAGLRRKTMGLIDALDDHDTIDADLADIFAASEAEAQTLLATILGG